jgi:gas vesicle protein
MYKLLSLAIGLLLGAAVGAALVVWFAPVTGDELKHNLREGYRETLAEARLAAEQRRRELEAELNTAKRR